MIFLAGVGCWESVLSHGSNGSQSICTMRINGAMFGKPLCAAASVSESRDFSCEVGVAPDILDSPSRVLR